MLCAALQISSRYSEMQARAVECSVQGRPTAWVMHLSYLGKPSHVAISFNNLGWHFKAHIHSHEGVHIRSVLQVLEGPRSNIIVRLAVVALF